MMTEATLKLKHHDEARALFGPGDANLRRLCGATGTQVVLRGNEIRIQGTEEQVNRCRETLQNWQSILQKKDVLMPSDLSFPDDPESSDDTSGSGNVLRSKEPVPFLPIEPSEKRRRPADREESSSNAFTAEMVASSRILQELRSGKDKVGRIRAKTEGQRRYMEAMRESELVFCEGPAGCGKTYLAVAMALEALRREQVRKIVLVRPAVEAGEKLGFLPGDMFAKVNPFLRPLLDAINDMLEFEQVRRYMSNDVIEIAPLAFMRGRTLNDTFIILDEGQNTTITQMKMFLTRMGVNSRIVVTGDATQNDLAKGMVSGLSDGMRRLSGIAGVAIVQLNGQDIVRHRLVREIVSAYETESSSS
ncbi:MAG: PhoH family protein [Planctomyces sp.]|jgi:phosphate starvation-inducible PhoH-like protein